MRRITDLKVPALAAVIKERTAGAAIAAIKNARYRGADMIDLHMPCLDVCDKSVLRRITESTPLPILALNYNNAYDGSFAGFSEDEREELFLSAIESGAAGVDIQGYTFDARSRDGFFGEDKYSFTKNAPKEVVTDRKIIDRQCAFIDRVHAMGGEVLLSCHPGIFMNAETVAELALFLEERKPDIIKIITVAENEDELIESLRTVLLLKKEIKTKVAYHAAGKSATLSRIINPVLGSFIAFCNDGFKANSTMEQVDLATARGIVDGLSKIIEI